MLSMLRCRCGNLRQLLEMLVEARAQHAALGFVGAGASEHDEVPRRRRAQMAKRFTGEALELVAVHGAFGGSTRDRQAKAGDAAATRSCQDGEETIVRTRGLGEDSPELCRFVQSLAGRETCRVREHRRAKTKTRYGVRRARPFARRLARTFRPALVAIRARNPCVRLRCKLLG